MPSKKKNRKKLVLLDAHAILHRAYHALPEFSTSKGEPTGALYGVVAMLLKLIAELEPDYIVAAYDLPEPTYRHEAFKDYKAGRAKTDDALALQIDRSRDVFEAFSIPVYEKAGYEADDVLGTIVAQVQKQAQKDEELKDLDVVIASGDMDTLQLVDETRVRVYTLKRGINDTILYDEKKVKERFGFGPELLPDYKGLRGDPSDNIPGVKGIGEKSATELIAAFGGVEDIYRKLKKAPKDFEKKGIKPRVVKLLEESEEEALFSKALGTIHRDVPITFALPKERWEDARDPKAVLACLRAFEFRTLALRAQKLLTLDEATDENPEEKDAPHEDVSEHEEKEVGVALWLLDTSITQPTRADILHYARTDSFIEAREKIFSEIEKRGLARVYENIEKPLISVIGKMEARGVRIDTAHLKKLSKEYHRELEHIQKEIWKHVGREFNINSPKQLGEVLFDELELGGKNHKKTPTGARSTRESELEKMRGEHPVIDALFEYRALQKLLSTYIDTIPSTIAPDGRLHATFLQTGTATGRMSSNNPNLQNIPIRTERGRNIRNAFVATKGFRLVALDYSQIELRIAAFLSGDEKLVEIFKQGQDVHTAVASEVFGVPPEHVDYEMRRRAKVINFGILYGMGVSALRQNLDASRAEAQQFYNDYFKNFSGLARYLERSKEHARRDGYTETYFGRRRYFENMDTALPQIRAAMERMALNAPIQGTSADIIKIAMHRIDAHITKTHLEEDAYLLLQVHDELVYEITEEKLPAVVGEIQQIMETVLALEETKGVPLVVNASAGENLGELLELDA